LQRLKGGRGEGEVNLNEGRGGYARAPRKDEKTKGEEKWRHFLFRRRGRRGVQAEPWDEIKDTSRKPGMQRTPSNVRGGGREKEN